jgi:hypothetical protein
MEEAVAEENARRPPVVKVTWRQLITKEMLRQNEGWSEKVYCTLTDNELDAKFDDGYGGSEGKAFTLWTQRRVYFPVVYDGSEWAASVPRDPCVEAMGHVGGE